MHNVYWPTVHPRRSQSLSPSQNIHTYIRLLTTSPKGLFSANYKEKDKNKNIYKLFKVTIANQLFACKADAMASLYNIRSVVISLIGFAAFLRFDELAELVRSDVEIKSDMLKLFIESSKTDQNRDGP